MFLGQFYHSLDEKGRLTVPARYRELLAAEGAYVIQGFDQNLMVLPSSTFEAISRRVNAMNMMDPAARLLRRLIFSTADRIEIDRAGRILLPNFLRQMVELESEVVIVGVGDYFEIWSANRWSSQAAQLQDTDANVQRFGALQLSSG